MPEIASPCISVCKIDPASELCQGCWRTRAEIKGWKTASENERYDLLQLLHQRREQAGAGGRKKTRRRRPQVIN